MNGTGLSRKQEPTGVPVPVNYGAETLGSMLHEHVVYPETFRPTNVV